MDDVLPKPALFSLLPNGEGDLWRLAVAVAFDGDGLPPKRPVGCVNEGGAVGGAPKPPKAGVAFEAKMLELLALLDGGGLAKRLGVMVLLDAVGLPNRLVLLDGAEPAEVLELLVLLDGVGLPKRPEPLGLVDEARLEPKRPVPEFVAKSEEPNPPPLALVADPKVDALLGGNGLEPNKPVVDPNPPAAVALVLAFVFGTLLAEAGAVVDPVADAVLVDACPGANEAPSDLSVFEVLPVDTDLELPNPPRLGAVVAVKALAEAGRVKLRKGLVEGAAVTVVELEVEVVLAAVGAVPNENGAVVLLAGVGVGFGAGALVVGRGAPPNEENKLEAGVGAPFAEAGRTAVLPVIVVLAEGAVVAPKVPAAGTVVVGAVGAAVTGCAGGGGAEGRNGAGGCPCVGAPG